MIVDYAHTPDSLENVITAARGLGGSRLTVVFGAGGDRDQSKRPLMGGIVSELADRTILTSDNPRSEDPEKIAADVAAGATRKIEIELDRRAAIGRALGEAQPGDIVLIAGRGAEPEQELAGGKIPFDDREVAREALAAAARRMIPLELALIEPLGRLNARPWATEVTGLQIDSRRIAEGDLFVAVGAGEDFVAHALARGAAAALVPENAHEALARIGAAVRDRSTARVVGITGATGKTTTKDILAALAAPRMRTVASEGNYNNELGVPLTLGRIEPDTELVIVEMGMRGLGQIAWLASFARPDIGLITNIAPVHLELVQTVENVARAKAELIEALPPGGTAVIPEEPLLDPYLTRDDIEVRRFGRVEAPGRFEVGGREIALETSFTAPHQLQNTLAALTVCDVLGILPDDGRLEVSFSPLREEVIELPDDVTLINDCYNANPASMMAALAHLQALAGARRKLAVLGEMAELGENAPAYHREIGEEAVKAGVASIVAVGLLAAEYLAAGAEGVQAATADDAADALSAILQPGDVVLVKGSRAVGLEAVAAKLRG